MGIWSDYTLFPRLCKFYFVTDQIKAAIQPKNVQLKARFNKNMARIFLCWRNEAIKKGKK